MGVLYQKAKPANENMYFQDPGYMRLIERVCKHMKIPASTAEEIITALVESLRIPLLRGLPTRVLTFCDVFPFEEFFAAEDDDGKVRIQKKVSAHILYRKQPPTEEPLGEEFPAHIARLACRRGTPARTLRADHRRYKKAHSDSV